MNGERDRMDRNCFTTQKALELPTVHSNKLSYTLCVLEYSLNFVCYLCSIDRHFIYVQHIFTVSRVDQFVLSPRFILIRRYAIPFVSILF